jgi:hypothetical protein
VTDDLIEKVARAINDIYADFEIAHFEASRKAARAALAAIDEKYLIIERPKPGALTQADVDRASDEIFRRAASMVEGTGTHVVVPIEPTKEMNDAIDAALQYGDSDPWTAMLAARPKVTP